MKMREELLKIYKYLVNEVNDKEIKELVMYLQDYVVNGSMQDVNIDYHEDNLTKGIQEEIYFVLNNWECEEWTKLTDEECDDIVENIISDVMNDDQVWGELHNSIEYYANKYINNKGE